MNRKIVNKKIVWSCFLLFSVIGLTAFAAGTLSEKNMPEASQGVENGADTEKNIMAFGNGADTEKGNAASQNGDGTEKGNAASRDGDNTKKPIMLSGNGCYSEQDILAAWGWEGRKPEEIEEYAGVYLDGQKNIVLLLVEKEENAGAYADAAKRLEDYCGMPKFILQPAKYNAATLSAVQDYFVKTAYSRETVRNMGVDVKNNRIEIGILPSEHLEEDKEFLYSLLEEIEGVSVERDILSFHDATGENYELRISLLEIERN